MEINELKLLLEDLQSVGIQSAIFEPNNGVTRVRGTDKDHNIVVFCDTEFYLSDSTIAINDIRSLLSRVRLFDDNKTKIEELSTDDVMDVLTFKEGRKKTTYQCSDVAGIKVPTQIPEVVEFKDENIIKLDDKYVTYFNNAISSISQTVSVSPSHVSIEVKNHEATISVSDGETDSFSDVIEDVGVKEVLRSSWEAVPFSKVMRQAGVEGQDYAQLVVTKQYGFAVFKVGFVEVIVTPAV